MLKTDKQYKDFSRDRLKVKGIYDMAFFCRKGKCLLTTALLYINIIALKTRASNISTDRERREGWLSSDYL